MGFWSSCFKFLACVVVFVLLVGCTIHVKPPRARPPTTTVYLVDYGAVHSSLLLPTSQEDNYVEYTYGDWSYMVLGYRNPLNSTRIMLFPTAGALGRRSIGGPNDIEKLKDKFRIKLIVPLKVNEDAARRLGRKLDSYFKGDVTSRAGDIDHPMTYVKLPDDSFWLLNNCNLRTAWWLEQLGAETSATTLFSRFEIEPGH